MENPDSSLPIDHATLPSRGMLAVIYLGLAMIICATLLLTWPSDVPGESHPRLVPHWVRMLGVPAEGFTPETGPAFDWIWRRVWDVLHDALVLVGLALAVWASLADRPEPWIGLMAVGALGVIYTVGVALYMGPMMAAPGYLLVLLGALLTVLTWKRQA